MLFKVFFLVAAIAVPFLSFRYVRDGRFYQGEYYFLLLASSLGMLAMPSSRDMLMLFIALELVSAPAFLLAGFRKSDPRSNEAALKFFLISVLSTAVMLYGMSLITGHRYISLADIAERLAGRAGIRPSSWRAILFVTPGSPSRSSAFPFQFWAPDTYEGPPVPIAAFPVVASKAAGSPACSSSCSWRHRAGGILGATAGGAVVLHHDHREPAGPPAAPGGAVARLHRPSPRR